MSGLHKKLKATNICVAYDLRAVSERFSRWANLGEEIGEAQ